MESTTQIFLRVQISDDEDHVIEGESLATGYADRMQIDSFSFGMDAKDQAQRPGKGANIDLSQVQVTKFFDLASTKLAGLLKPSEREKEPKLLHEVRITIDQQLEEVGERGKMEKQQNAILVFHLFSARLVDIKLDVSGDTRATTLKETLSFTFKNFSVEYYYKSMENNKKSDYRDKWLGFETEHPEHDLYG